MIKTRTMAREPWKRILQREYRFRVIKDADFDGEAAWLRLIKVASPLVKRMGERDVRIVDDGFHWLQLAPRGKKWWLTVMFDDMNRITQYYFDVTRENVLTGDGKSYFYDMFLDVVALPDGAIFLLDADELDAALADGEISPDEREAAREEANRIIARAREALPELTYLVRRYDDMLARADGAGK